MKKKIIITLALAVSLFALALFTGCDDDAYYYGTQTSTPTQNANDSTGSQDSTPSGNATVIGPTSIVEESPLLGALSEADKDLFLRMNYVETRIYTDRYSVEEIQAFSRFVFDTIRIDFDRRLAERGINLTWIDNPASIPEHVSNLEYLYALVYSGFWENDGSGLVYNQDLYRKVRKFLGNGTSLSLPDKRPEYDAESNSIRPPLIIPFTFTTYRYFQVRDVYEDRYSVLVGVTTIDIEDRMQIYLGTQASGARKTSIGDTDLARISIEPVSDGSSLTKINAISGVDFSLFRRHDLDSDSDVVVVNDYPEEIIRHFG